MSSEKQYGMTPPLSTTLPTEEENRATELMLEELRKQGTFESAAETQKRHEVLVELQKIADAFVQKVAKEQFKDNPSFVKNARGRVFTYGSFRLGVYGPGSDIDTLVVVPKYCSRENYFQYFPELLQSMAPPGAITDLTPVEGAFVPIIKFEFSGISIDLIFSKVIMSVLPAEKDWNLKDSILLRGLDEGELRSLNGTRVTDEILSLVPEQRTFRDALRAVKLWAQRKAIYANIMGFPGGVAWAMMVARVCQLYPRATSGVVVSKFFGIIYKWPWPNPILLKPIDDGPLPVRVWNPKLYKGDSFHLMPIITPAYPSMCATYNITKSSAAIIQKELYRAWELSQQIVGGRKPWKELFTKHTFFTTDYKYYLSVTSSSSNKEAHKLWSGLVESKVRLLVGGLERHQSIAIARPFNKGYERTHLCKTDEEIRAVRNGDLSHVISKEVEDGNNVKAEIVDIKIKPEIKPEGEDPQTAPKDDMPAPAPVPITKDSDNKDKDDDKDSKFKPDSPGPDGTILYTLTHYIGLALVEGHKSLDLSFEVNDFKETCFSWDKFQEDLCDVSTVNIQYVRNFALPDDVFESGEIKPSRPAKSKKNGVVKKRSASEEPTNPPKRQQTAAAD